MSQANIDEVLGSLRKSKLPFGPHKGELKSLEHYAFRDDPKESKVFWDVRKGLIPIVGGARESGALLPSPWSWTHTALCTDVTLLADAAMAQQCLRAVL